MELFQRQGAAVKKSLERVAADPGEKLALLLGLNTFGNHRQPHGTAERDDGLGNGGAALIGQDIPNEGDR